MSTGAPDSTDGPHRPLVVVSNRGPVTFRVGDDGDLVAKRGAGGLVSGIGPLLVDTDATWIAAAMSDGDRIAAEQGVIEAEGFRVRALALDPEQYRMAYDVVSNATLWFVHHHLYELARRPRFDTRWRAAWDAYRTVNEAFARVIVGEAPADATVLVQDYHLALVGRTVRAERPDLRTAHFSHTPFAVPDLFAVLPDDIADEYLAGMASFDACGFHTTRWAEAFAACCAHRGIETPTTFVSPLATDQADIRGVAASDACQAAGAVLRDAVGDRRLIARVDRIELSKNLLRGFLAYEDLLERWPQWRERVVFGAFVYASREGLAEYLAYRQEVETLVARINGRWGTDTWTPILLDTGDDFPASVAALRLYDVLLVNPIRDGLNLVATEGCLVNENDGVLLLSPEAGAFERLGDAVVRVNPFDVASTAEALHEALSLAPPARAAHAARLRALAEARSPSDWLREQRAAAEA